MIDVDLSNDPSLTILLNASQRVARGYYLGPEYPDHLYQVAYEWRLRHPETVETLLSAGDTRKLSSLVHDYLLGVAQAEKAAVGGYSPDDVAYYSPRTLAEMLPACFEIDESVLSAAAPGEGSGSGHNPHGQGDYIATLMDVRHAWEAAGFRDDERHFIDAHYRQGYNIPLLAITSQTTQEEVKRQLSRGLRRMVEVLGGFRGKGCNVDCVDCWPVEEVA